MAKTKVLCIGKKDRGMEREEKMEESIEKKGFMRLRCSSREWAHFKCSKCPAEKWHEVIGLGTWMSLTGL